jgi:hypothetical protein
MQSRQGVLHFRIKGKRGKVRFVPVQVLAQRLIEEYLALAGHAADSAGPVFRPVTNNRTGDLDRLSMIVRSIPPRCIRISSGSMDWRPVSALK